tara:strand:- start:19 stop:2235 length:2217 start_codon:yes stop_codon:yes gene_type:complete
MLNPSKVERKTKAIMFTDIAGYTQAMSESEQKALEMLRKKRTIIKTLIDNHNGKYVKEIGDGTLSYFESGYNASSCAKELQKQVKLENLDVRVGIHIGDIVFDNNDVYGDGVNVASRLESLAPAGGVLISKNVYDELLNKDDFDGVPLGLQSLKGVGRLVEVYAIKDEYLVIPKTGDYKLTEVEKHNDDEVPSIAIIPFKNKGAEEDIFYAYGISADLISDCSGAGLIRVAGLNDIEKIDYANLKYEEISKDLSVRYVSTGTLWKMGNMFQLSIELYDTKEKKVVWSDRWQEQWDNLSSLKSNLSDGILKSLDIMPEVKQTSNITNPEAYEFYLKAKHKYDKRENTDDIEIVRGFLNKAIQLDDNLIIAQTLIGTTYLDSQQLEKALLFFKSALKIAKNNNDKRGLADSLYNIGCYHFQIGDIEIASSNLKEALDIYTQLDDKNGIGKVFIMYGSLYWSKNDLETAVKYDKKSLKLFEELGDLKGVAINLVGIGIYHSSIMKDNKKALGYYNKALKIFEENGFISNLPYCLNCISNSYYVIGDFDIAIKYLNRVIKIEEELGNDFYTKNSITLMAQIYNIIGDHVKSLKLYKKLLNLFEKCDDKNGIAYSMTKLGISYYYSNKYQEAIDSLKSSLVISKEIDQKEIVLEATTFLSLSYMYFEKDYDKSLIYSLIKKTENINFEISYQLFKLLEENTFLNSAYNQIQEKLDAMEDELKEKFLNYPIPKQILEEWNEINN